MVSTNDPSGNGPVGSIRYESWIQTARAALLVGKDDSYSDSALEMIASDQIEHWRWTSRYQAHILLERLVCPASRGTLAG
jgi:hypothetical protein